MQITLITKTGSMGVIKPVKNKTSLGADLTCRIEVENFSRILHVDQLVGGVFAPGDPLYLTVADYPSFENPNARCVASGKSSSVYSLDVRNSDVSSVIHSLRAFQFGEFSIFSSRNSADRLVAELDHLDRFDALSVLSRRELQVCALVGLDVESDAATVASINEALIFRIVSVFLEGSAKLGVTKQGKHGA